MTPNDQFDPQGWSRGEEIEQRLVAYGLSDWSFDPKDDGSMDLYRLNRKTRIIGGENPENVLGHDEMDRILRCFNPTGWRISAIVDTGFSDLNGTFAIATPGLTIKLWWGS